MCPQQLDSRCGWGWFLLEALGTVWHRPLSQLLESTAALGVPGLVAVSPVIYLRLHVASPSV